MAEDPFIDALAELASDLGRQARVNEAPGCDQYSFALQVRAEPSTGPGRVRVSIRMIIEPFSEEQPVEEDEVLFTLASDRFEAVTFRRFFLDQREEPQLARDADSEARLIADIRAFFSERMGAGLAG